MSRLNIAANVLDRTIKEAAAACSRNRELLKNVLITVGKDGLSVAATNGELSIVSRIGCEAVKPGQCLVSPQRLRAWLGTVGSQTCELDISKKGVTVSVANSELEIAGADPADFPPHETPEDGTVLTIEDGAFQAAVGRAVKFTDPDSTSYALSGVLLDIGDDGVFVVGSNRKSCITERLPYKPIERSEWILPQELCHAVAALTGTVTVRLGEKVVSIEAESASVSSPYLAGKFPAWRKIIPTPGFSVSLSPEELLTAVSRVVAGASPDKDGFIAIDWHMMPTWIELKASGDSGRGSATVNHQVESGDVVKYEGRFGRDVLRLAASAMADCESMAVCPTADDPAESATLITSGTRRVVAMPMLVN